MTPGPALAVPANDDFADATVVTSGTGHVFPSAEGATREPGEPNHAGISDSGSIWYRWTAEDNMAGHVQVCCYGDPVALAVYTGSSLETLKLVTDNRGCPRYFSRDDSGDQYGACVWFTAFANTTYRIAVVPLQPFPYVALAFAPQACTVEGSAGNDSLWVTSSLDVVCGYGGNDTIHADGPVDDLGEYRVYEDTILGGPGADTIDYGGAASGVRVDATTGITTFGSGSANREQFLEIGNVAGSAYSDRLDGNNARNVLDGGTGTDVINGKAGGDLIRGGGGVDNLAGNEGNDALYGGGSNDLLFPGAGDDTIWGESGMDAVSYAGAPTSVTVDLAAWSATGWGTDVLNGIEHAIGSSFADVLRGSTVQNILRGGGGADTLRTNDGVAGDTADGGRGTDSCFTDPGDSRISCP